MSAVLPDVEALIAAAAPQILEGVTLQMKGAPMETVGILLSNDPRITVPMRREGHVLWSGEFAVSVMPIGELRRIAAVLDDRHTPKLAVDAPPGLAWLLVSVAEGRSAHWSCLTRVQKVIQSPGGDA